jgi:protein-disulfide isomerase
MKKKKTAAAKTPPPSRAARRAALWGTALIGLAATVGLIVYLASAPGPGPSPAGPSAPAPIDLAVGPDEWIEGNPEAAATLVMYSDFQCPACGAYFPLVQRLRVLYGDRLRIVYREFPLEQIHPRALQAAKVAEAAGLQGKFWAMHDLLFQYQGRWSAAPDPVPLFLGYAKALKLDIDRFQADMDSPRVAEAIREDVESGTRFGVPGTPTFFLNGVRIQNPRSYEAFKAVINGAIGSGS